MHIAIIKALDHFVTYHISFVLHDSDNKCSVINSNNSFFSRIPNKEFLP